MPNRSMFSLWILVAAITTTLPFSKAEPQKKDMRKVIQWPPQDVLVMKGHMRASLVMIQTILEKSASNDWKGVKVAATPLTTKALAQGMKDFSGPPPKEFIAMATPMHKLFDEIVRDADKVKQPAHTVKQVTKVLATCNGCHSYYRFP